jgi:hypothetical protein
MEGGGMSYITQLELNEPRTAHYPNNQENSNMAFVNEYISKEDFEKYNFAELNKRPRKGGTADDWTIDREADIWIRHFYTESDHTEPDGGYTGVVAWDFYWKGFLMMVEVLGIETGGGVGKL